MLAMEPPQDVYSLMMDMRRSFEKIMSILQEDEQRVRQGYHLLQQERDAMARAVSTWHLARGPSPWESTVCDRADEEPPQVNEAGVDHFHTPPERRYRLTASENGGDLNDEPSGLLHDNPGGTEVTLNQQLSPPHGAVGMDTEAEEGEADSSTGAGLARVPTNPPRDGCEVPVAQVGTDKVPFEKGEAAASVTRVPRERDAALVSPTRETDAATPQPDNSSGATHTWESERESAAYQDELRLYACAVRQPSASRHVPPPPTRSALEAGLLPRARYDTRYGSDNTQDTLAESDCTTTMTNSSYGRQQEAERRSLDVYKRMLHRSRDAAPATTALVPFQSHGYASQQVLPRTRDATTGTLAGGLSRSLLGVGNSALADTKLSRGFWVHVWPCFGTFSATTRPARVYVYGHYRRLEDVLEKAADSLHCKPAPPYLFEPDGEVVRSLRQLVPEQHYLLFPSGGFYRQDAVPSALLRHMVQAARHTLSDRSS